MRARQNYEYWNYDFDFCAWLWLGSRTFQNFLGGKGMILWFYDSRKRACGHGLKSYAYGGPMTSYVGLYQETPGRESWPPPTLVESTLVATSKISDRHTLLSNTLVGYFLVTGGKNPFSRQILAWSTDENWAKWREIVKIGGTDDPYIVCRFVPGEAWYDQPTSSRPKLPR